MSRKKNGKNELTSSKPDSYTLDMNRINLKKAYYNIGFKTGAHKSDKDRPRIKVEYYDKDNEMIKYR